MAKCWRCRKNESEKSGRVCRICSEELDSIREGEEEAQQMRCDERWHTGIFSNYN